MTKKFGEHLSVLFLMLLVSLVATWPLANHFFTAIPSHTTAQYVSLNKPGDSLQLFYWFWLLKDNLFGASTFLHNPYEFNMVAGSSSGSLYMYPFYFLFLLFAPLGDIGAYNSLVLVSYMLTGYFTWLLVRVYTDCRSAALVAALIYTLLPIRVINLMGGHLNGFIYYLIPASLYLLEKSFRSKNMIFAILCGMSIFWLSLLEVHLIYYVVVFLGVYLPLRILFVQPAEAIGNDPVAVESGACRSSKARWLSLLELYGAGVALTIIYQTWAVWRFKSLFFTGDFWIILGLYPLLFFFFMLFVAVLLRSSLRIGLSCGIDFLAVSLRPLYLLPLYHLHLLGSLRHFGLVIAGIVFILLPFSIRYAWKRALTGVVWERPVFFCQENLHRLWSLLPVAIGLLLSVGWVMFVKKVFFTGSIAHGGRTIQDVRLFSPKLMDLITQGSSAYFGAIPLLLVMYALVLLVQQLITREKETRYPLLDLIWLSFFSFFFLLAYVLGAGLSFGASSLYVLFFDYFPYFNFPRVPDRIMSIAFLCGAVLVGFAIRDMRKRFAGRLTPLELSGFILFFTGFFLIDFGVGKPVALTRLDRGQTIYHYVKEHIGNQLLLELPLWPGDSHQSSLYEYYVTLDQIRRVNGYTPIVTQEYLDRIYRPLATLNRGNLDLSQYHVLRKMGVKFVTVHDNPDVFPSRVSPYPPVMTVRRLMQSPYLEYIPLTNMINLPDGEQENRNLYLFRVLDENEAKVAGEETKSCPFFIPNMYPASSLAYITGGLAQDDSIGRKILLAVEGKNKSHYLSYGPYEELPAGEYQVYFRMRTNMPGSDKEIARIDVAGFTGHERQEVLVSRVLRGGDFRGDGYQDFSLTFSLQETKKLEFRTWFSGNGELRLEKVVLTCPGTGIIDSHYEAEDLLADTGFLVQDEHASGGVVVFADAGHDKSGRMMYGPYHRLPAGRYRVVFYLKSGDVKPGNQNAAVVDLVIRTDDDRTELARRSMLDSEIHGEEYVPVVMEMIIKRDNEVSFEAYFHQHASIWLDRIEIARLSGANSPVLSILNLLGKKHGKKL